MELDLVLGSPRESEGPIFVNTNVTPHGQAAAVVVRGCPGSSSTLRLTAPSIFRMPISEVALMRRVVVTGMGMVTPLGRDMETTW